MATIEDNFKQVVDDFVKRLKPDEKAAFASTTLSELQNEVVNLQERQRKSKTAQNLRRIDPLLQAMSQYTQVIEVFLNTSSILCFVWGPMKFIASCKSMEQLLLSQLQK
jgi:DNA helicase IV